MKNLNNILWGIVLIIVGVLFGLNALGITSINIFFDGWWTLFIIVPCFIELLTDKDKVGSLIGMIVGCALLLACLDIINFNLIWKLLVPTVLVIIGLSLVFKDVIGSKISNEIKKINKSNKSDNEYAATFSSQNVSFNNEVFDGANIDTVFGAAKLDLRQAIIKKDCVINISSIFGGCDVYVPADVNIKVKSTSIFGGVSNKYQKNNDKKITIYINATCVFGGVEIK